MCTLSFMVVKDARIYANIIEDCSACCLRKESDERNAFSEEATFNPMKVPEQEMVVRSKRTIMNQPEGWRLEIGCHTQGLRRFGFTTV